MGVATVIGLPFEFTVATSTDDAGTAVQGDNPPGGVRSTGLPSSSRNRCSFGLYQAALAAADEYLRKQGLADYDAPAGGLYLWLKLADDLPDSEVLAQRLAEQGVIVTPGTFFELPLRQDQAGRDSAGWHEGKRYLRLGWPALAAELVTEGIRRIGNMIMGLTINVK